MNIYCMIIVGGWFKQLVKLESLIFNCVVFMLVLQYGEHLYNFIYTLVVCMSVRLYPINVKTAEPIGPKFCVWPCNRMTQGRFMDAHNYKKVLIFVKLKKKSANFFCYAFILYKKNMLTERATIKIEIEVGCKAP